MIVILFFNIPAQPNTAAVSRCKYSHVAFKPGDAICVMTGPEFLDTAPLSTHRVIKPNWEGGIRNV